jgi:hypothetical protein
VAVTDTLAKGELRAEADRVCALLHGLCEAWEDGSPPASTDLDRVIADLGRLRTLVEGAGVVPRVRDAGR